MALLLPLLGSSRSLRTNSPSRQKSGKEVEGTLFQTLVCCAGGQHKSVRGKGRRFLGTETEKPICKLGSLTEGARWFFSICHPNQRFLVIESLKSPSGLPSISFSGPILRFLHITGTRKQLEGCWLEKEGSFPAQNPGSSAGSVSNVSNPFKLTLIHLKVWLLVPNYKTLWLSLLNGWKGCYCGSPCWRTLRREF